VLHGRLGRWASWESCWSCCTGRGCVSAPRAAFSITGTATGCCRRHTVGRLRRWTAAVVADGRACCRSGSPRERAVTASSLLMCTWSGCGSGGSLRSGCGRRSARRRGRRRGRPCSTGSCGGHTAPSGGRSRTSISMTRSGLSTVRAAAIVSGRCSIRAGSRPCSTSTGSSQLVTGCGCAPVRARIWRGRRFTSTCTSSAVRTRSSWRSTTSSGSCAGSQR
jgi:hypothetical protein